MIASSLPASWRMVSLKDVAANKPNAIVDGPFGSNLKSSDYVASGIPVLQGKNITNDTFKWFDVRYISEKKADELKRSSVRENDILVVKIGSIGYSAIVDSLFGHDFAIIPANLVKVTPNTDAICTKYLHHWLTSPEAKQYLISNASKTAQPALSLGKIKDLPLPLPPLPEQRRIAAILDQADALRAKRREALTQLDSLTKSIFIEMFGERAELPTSQLGKICTMKRGPFGGALKKEIFVQDGPMVYEQRNAIQDNCLTGRYFISESKFREMQDFAVLPNDIIVSCSGTIGKVAIAPHEAPRGIINQALLRIRVHTSIVTPLYLKHALDTHGIQNQLTGLSHGTGLQNFPPMSEVKALVIPLPSIERQQAFEAQLRVLEGQRALVNESANELNSLFASLQHNAFRGEL